MTPEQAQLVLQIVSNLASDWRVADEENLEGYVCKYCRGRIIPRHGWEHTPYCIVPMVERLRETMYENCQ